VKQLLARQLAQAASSSGRQVDVGLPVVGEGMRTSGVLRFSEVELDGAQVDRQCVSMTACPGEYKHRRDRSDLIVEI
jgi:hypothetical protein